MNKHEVWLWQKTTECFRDTYNRTLDFSFCVWQSHWTEIDNSYIFLCSERVESLFSCPPGAGPILSRAVGLVYSPGWISLLSSLVMTSRSRQTRPRLLPRFQTRREFCQYLTLPAPRIKTQVRRKREKEFACLPVFAGQTKVEWWGWGWKGVDTQPCIL